MLYYSIIINSLCRVSSPPPPACAMNRWGFRGSLLQALWLGCSGETEPRWVPDEILESLEGDHGPHSLGLGGEATVHEELRAVSQQLRVADTDGHGHPAVGWGGGVEAAACRSGPKSHSCPRSSSEPAPQQSLLKEGGLESEVEGIGEEIPLWPCTAHQGPGPQSCCSLTGPPLWSQCTWFYRHRCGGSSHARPGAGR